MNTESTTPISRPYFREYTDRGGTTSYVGMSGRTFSTAEARESDQLAQDAYHAAIGAHVEVDRAGNWSLPTVADRAEYERLVHALDSAEIAPVWSDEEIRDHGYGIRYVEPRVENGANEAIRMLALRFAGLRLNALEAGDRQQAAARLKRCPIPRSQVRR